MTKKSSIFEKICKEYLARIANLDLEPRSGKLGVRMCGDKMIIPFLGKCYKVSAGGIFDPAGEKPSHAVNIVLCKYIILCPDTYPETGNWVSYKDFKDAAPFVGGFTNNAERPIAKNFSHKLGKLEEACKKLGGRPPDIELSYQLSIRFDPLPKVPLLMLFNDQDDEFPAQCNLLYRESAKKYLDMECLAIVAWLLSDYLNQAAGSPNFTII